LPDSFYRNSQPLRAAVEGRDLRRELPLHSRLQRVHDRPLAGHVPVVRRADQQVEGDVAAYVCGYDRSRAALSPLEKPILKTPRSDRACMT
jgi:hypothetical protein